MEAAAIKADDDPCIWEDTVRLLKGANVLISELLISFCRTGVFHGHGPCFKVQSELEEPEGE